MAVAPLPPAAELLSTVRSSCRQLRLASDIQVNNAAADELLRAITAEEWADFVGNGGAKHGIRLPLRFDSDEEELNVICILSLLNFLSGYRHPLHRLTGRGAWSTILTLVLAAHLSGPSTSSPLTAAGMIASTPSTLASLINIKTHVEKDHPTLGAAVKVGEKDADAFEVLELLAGTLNETGKVLQKEGKKDLGAWLGAKLDETGGDAPKMVVELARTFPTFNDSAVVDGQPVYLFKKAFFLLNAIAERFASPSTSAIAGDNEEEDAARIFPFPVPDVSGFPIFADNVIPTMLLHLNILTLPPSSAISYPFTPSRSLSSSDAYRLRAAAVNACSSIVARARELALEPGREWLSGVTETDVDAWLWGKVGKTEEGRKVERFAEKGTAYY
ncbi:DUF2419 family protein [Pseudohyphozyma bogoriensis]|nr:DUF2419 family protein [Pseudohyphozyma bogoriensis]